MALFSHRFSHHLWILCLTNAFAFFFIADVMPAADSLEMSQEERKEWKSSPKTKEELDPQTREQYEKLRAKLSEAEKEYDQLKQKTAAENELLETAYRLRQEASATEQQLKPAAKQVKNYFKRFSGGSLQNQNQLRNAFTKLKEYEFFTEMENNPVFRPYVLFFARQMILELQNSSQSGNKRSDFVQDLLPQPDAKITESQALEIYLKILERYKDQALAKVGNTSNFDQLLPFVQEYIEAKVKNDFQFLICDTYYRLNKPVSESVAKQNISELHQQLSEVWPRWRWAEAPEEIRNPPNQRGNLNAMNGDYRWWLLIVNIAVIVLLIGVLIIRRHLRERGSHV
ncbi:hypothetical protein [Gimesia fumaroli]|jgi:small-conductance mechanosensitive channel|uniref:Uncharacterized protein n=1 Tax=Gimesia fumaroli TaxID=2527976 RepID=A0A518IH19_9PLAN|nr:hypothetical protein [Gimesia fumaroli]QDV52350.1 hypothetical protein Enr17x_44120 [Gimesia fumaroli]